MILDKIYIKVRNLKNKYFGNIRKKKIPQDITIISNNCWGGLVYQFFNIKYNSPTIGLFFCPDDYLNFVSNLKRYINIELEKVNLEDSHNYVFLADHIKKGDYKSNLIIGKLDDVEIIFLHYSSFEEAKEKWQRRCSRINYDKILYKFNNNNGFNIEHYYRWNSINLGNKIFISDIKAIGESEQTYYVPRSLSNDNGVNDTTYYDVDINLIKLMNSVKSGD